MSIQATKLTTGAVVGEYLLIGTPSLLIINLVKFHLMKLLHEIASIYFHGGS